VFTDASARFTLPIERILQIMANTAPEQRRDEEASAAFNIEELRKPENNQARPWFTPENMGAPVGQPGAQASAPLPFPQRPVDATREATLKETLGVGDKIKVKHATDGEQEIEVQDFMLAELDEVMDRMANIVEVIAALNAENAIRMLRLAKEKGDDLYWLVEKVTGKDREWMKGVPMHAGGLKMLEATWGVCESFFALLTGQSIMSTPAPVAEESAAGPTS
jgi:hypothetical protein